eukprot:8359743-Pyramimonas_sp.AAC.1
MGSSGEQADTACPWPDPLDCAILDPRGEPPGGREPVNTIALSGVGKRWSFFFLRSSTRPVVRWAPLRATAPERSWRRMM